MRRVLPFFGLLLFFGFNWNPVRACNLSDLSLTSITWDSNNQQWVIEVLLHVGGGRTGVTTGGDNDTRSIAFGFYKSCLPSFAVQSFLPATIVSQGPGGCANTGQNLGAQGSPYNTQGTILYLDPGYYGQQPCLNQPLACVSSTALCGNVYQASYSFTFRTNHVPDSLRVFGVEGNGAFAGGCIGPDMVINFCALGYCNYNITCPGPQIIPAGPSCQGVIPNYTGLAGVSLNCVGGQPTITQSPTAGTTVGGLGTTTNIQLTATYPGPNMVNCTFPATVADITPPMITCPPATTVPLNASCQATLGNYIPAANISDNCTAFPTVTQNPPPGTVLNGAFGTVVTISATDGAGNSSVCTFIVTPVESTPPTITCPGNTTLNLNANCQATLPNYTSQATATDNCAPAPSIAQSPPVGTVLTGTGTTTVTLTATDGSGNTSTCAFTVTRIDALPPTLTCNSNPTLGLDANCQASLPNYTILTTAFDNCGGVTLVQSPAAGTTITGPGTSTVTFTATDGSGNSSTCSITVTAVDQTPPVITCPGNSTLSLNASCEAVLPNYSGSATDNCTVNPSIAQSPAAGSTVAGLGPHTVTLTATDLAGNSSTCAFTVTGNAPSVSGSTVQNPTSACVGTTVNLTAQAGASSYLWSTGVTAQSIQVTAGGWYWVDVTLAGNCTSRDSIFVVFDPLPQPLVTQVGNQVCTGTFASYQWYLNGSVIPGANGPCTPITVSGNYTVTVVDTNGCQGSSSGLTVLGLQAGMMVLDFTVYPSPARDRVFVAMTQPMDEACTVILFDLTGKMVRRWELERLESQQAFSLEGLVDGCYLMELKSATMRGVKKVVRLR